MYRDRGRTVFVLHGGPGAPGYMATVAGELGDGFRTVEPLQRPGSDGGLSVERHVDDLRECITRLGDGGAPLILGHSWGAMLALAYGARYPERLGGMVLVGSGTFDVASRDRLGSVREERLGEPVAAVVARIGKAGLGAEGEMKRIATVLFRTDSYDLVDAGSPASAFDPVGHDATWSDMMRLQGEGVYPAAFRAITCPVLMVHGESDPHPGLMIRDSLAAHLPQLEYNELPECGHYPWLERSARDRFYKVVRKWLAAH